MHGGGKTGSILLMAKRLTITSTLNASGELKI